MTYSFRPAVRDKVQLIFGLAGASGSGKTYSLLMVALGLAYPEAHDAAELNAIIEREGRNRIAFIDTERGRALHYAPPPGEKPDPWRREGAWFPFDHASLEPPFRPDAYTQTVEAADKAGYTVIIVDSGSHEWAGEGGVLEWHEEEQEEAAQRRAQRYNRAPGYQDYEAVKMTAWIKPKMAHKKMVGKLTTLAAHLLIGLRAEQKVQFVQEYDDKGEKVGKEKIVAAKDLPPVERWFPVCEKAFPYELTLSFVLVPDQPGVPHPVKLQDQHRPFVALDRPLSDETGRQLAAWARGAKPGGSAPATGSQASAGNGGGKTKRTPAELTDAYIAGLKSSLDGGKVDSLEELATYQANANRFLSGLRSQHPDLHERCVEANSSRYSELSSSSSGSGLSSANESGGLEGPDSLFPEQD